MYDIPLPPNFIEIQDQIHQLPNIQKMFHEIINTSRELGYERTLDEIEKCLTLHIYKLWKILLSSSRKTKTDTELSIQAFTQIMVIYITENGTGMHNFFFDVTKDLRYILSQQIAHGMNNELFSQLLALTNE